MRVLIACEESQEVCKAFRAMGHESYSCDIEPCSGGHPEWHIQGDVIPLLKEKWDMIIAFPPCTYLSNMGARHLWKGHVLNEERFEKGMAGREFFMKIWNNQCPMIVIENPTPSKIYNLPKYTQTIQPYQFGHPFSKRTHLWIKGLPNLIPTKIVEPERTWCPSGSYSKSKSDKHRGMFTTDRAKNRSKTFPGIAQAMAEQWGDYEDRKHKSMKGGKR